jgi:hypothetical protein
LQVAVLKIFDALEGETAGACVDALADRFLTAPIAAQQRVALAQMLGAKSPSDALNPKDIPAPQRMAAVHMLTSLAEYQLC